MTRSQFDARFRATQDTTEGFTDAELAAINDTVFAQVSGLDVGEAGEAVKHAFERAFRGAE